MFLLKADLSNKFPVCLVPCEGRKNYLAVASPSRLRRAVETFHSNTHERKATMFLKNQARRRQPMCLPCLVVEVIAWNIWTLSLREVNFSTICE